MIDLGINSAPSILESTTLDLDEMQLLVERLELAELPVVLNALGRYDNEEAHAAAMVSAEASLTARGLLDGREIHSELADRLHLLARPHWVVALRLFIGDTISRLCIAKGDDVTVLVMRGPDSYVISDAGHDLTAKVVAALGPAEALEINGLNAPTEALGRIFDDSGDAQVTAKRLAEIGVPPREAGTVASAMVHCYAHCEIVGLIYGHGTREQAENHIAVFDTKDGRFIATASVAADGTTWSALSTGTDARIRQALQALIDSLPEREVFPHASTGS